MKKMLLTMLIIGCCTISSTSFADEIITEIATPVEVTEVNANTTETEINTEPNQTIEEAKTITLTGEATFDWLDISQIERDTIIENYKNIIFGENEVYKYKKKEFRAQYKEFLKDEKNRTHYIEASNGITETKNYRLCGFFSGNILVSYAIQYKGNPRTAYYYDAFGRLRYVDVISDNYPNFPYWSKQYKANGKMISAIYFTSHDMQYMYKPDGDFQGVWFKDKRYTRDAKQDMTRTNW